MDMLEYFRENDTFLKECGAALTKCEPGRAELELCLEPRHMTSVGRLHAHAGLIYTMAESASAAAMLSYGWNAYAVDGSITYFDAVSSGKLRAVARGKDMHEGESGSCRVTIYGEDDAVIAKANFTILYTGEPFKAE